MCFPWVTITEGGYVIGLRLTGSTINANAFGSIHKRRDKQSHNTGTIKNHTNSFLNLQKLATIAWEWNW
ncbi:hypothetical protein BH18THE2_BH18THE2_29940 [soil metagenome]